MKVSLTFEVLNVVPED